MIVSEVVSLSCWRSAVDLLADVMVLPIRRQVVIRARNLRTNAQFIPAKAFKARKVYYTNEVIIILSEAPKIVYQVQLRKGQGNG